MLDRELTLAARYVFTAAGPPFARGSVSVARGRITRVGPAPPRPDVDFPDAAILPGLVNAHTHLELSSVRAKHMPATGFVTWLGGVIAARRGQSEPDLCRAIERGIDASLSAGTTLVGDISTAGLSWKILARSPMRANVFCELIGLRAERAAETLHAARRWLERDPVRGGAADRSPASPKSGRRAAVFEDCTPLEPLAAAAPPPRSRHTRPGLAPHAPYSTHPLLYEAAADWSCRSRLPVCTHLAETPAELELLAGRRGPLHDFLESMQAWSETWQPLGPEPVDYVTAPGTRAADWLVAHGNYFDAAAIARLVRSAQETSGHCAVVFCPRTHAYFGHRPHPYRAMLDAGLPVCLGTDSLASNPTLSVLDEMRFLYRRHPDTPGATILRMATLAGARALGWADVCGSLEAGKAADLTIVRLPNREESDPHRLLFDSPEPVLQTWIDGRLVFQRR